MKGKDGLLKRYTFADITVFMNTGDSGQYLNLTDFEITQEKEILEFDSNSKYIMMFCSFMYHAYKRDCTREKPYICDVTIEELKLLAGIHDKNFIDRLRGCSDEDELLAVIFAKKIMNYKQGRITRLDETTYQFDRQAYNGKQKVYKPVCNKIFYQG
jgi:hypothetical protein